VDLLYLDSMDTYVAGHAEHCLAESEGGRPARGSDGYVLIDDTWQTPDGWSGKGALAVPWLLANGLVCRRVELSDAPDARARVRLRCQKRPVPPPPEFSCGSARSWQTFSPDDRYYWMQTRSEVSHVNRSSRITPSSRGLLSPAMGAL